MKVQPYLNFDGTAQEAFAFYRSVFGGDFVANMKMSESPGTENLPEEEKNRTLHIALPIGGGIMLMASDIIPSMGHKLNQGNGLYISLHPDSREEADRIFKGLSAGGKVEMPMANQFWGDYFGSFVDKFGVHWMINYSARNQ